LLELILETSSLTGSCTASWSGGKTFLHLSQSSSKSDCGILGLFLDSSMLSGLFSFLLNNDCLLFLYCVQCGVLNGHSLVDFSFFNFVFFDNGCDLLLSDLFKLSGSSSSAAKSSLDSSLPISLLSNFLLDVDSRLDKRCLHLSD